MMEGFGVGIVVGVIGGFLFGYYDAVKDVRLALVALGFAGIGRRNGRAVRIVGHLEELHDHVGDIGKPEWVKIGKW